MEWLIVARGAFLFLYEMSNFNPAWTVVQGMGGGGMSGLSSIIVADLVPLSERGAYQGFKTMMWACAAGIGPIIVGAHPLQEFQS
jgi:MFS family permease